MPEEIPFTTARALYWGVIVIAPMVIGVSLAGIYSRYIQAKKREAEILREDAERYYDAP